VLLFRYTPRFKKRYIALPLSEQIRVDRAINLLGANWKHPGLQVKKLKGFSNIWEARISLGYRLTFHFEDKYRGFDVCVLRTVGSHDILRQP
jgi:mRNA-degrading endonuclease RelE of RelBE toxin-antitoxin system